MNMTQCLQRTDMICKQITVQYGVPQASIEVCTAAIRTERGKTTHSGRWSGGRIQRQRRGRLSRSGEEY